MRRRKSGKSVLITIDNSQSLLEWSTIGMLLMDHDRWDDVVRTMPTEAVFEAGRNRGLYRILLEAYHAGETLSPAVLAERAKTRGIIKTPTEEGELLTIREDIPSTSALLSQCEHLARCYQFRKIGEVGAGLQERAKDGRGDPRELMSGFESDLLKITAMQPANRRAFTAGLQDRLNRMIAPKAGQIDVRIKTRLAALNKHLGGLYRGEMCVIGAQPSMGKTALALDIAVHGLNAGLRTLYISRDQDCDDLALRVITGQTGISKRDMNEYLRAGDQQLLFDVATRLSAVSELLQVIDAPVSVLDVETESRRMKRQSGLDVVIVDYITLLSRYKDSENQNLWVTEMSARLKDLAKELDVVMVVVSQLNRSRVNAHVDIKRQLYGLPNMSMLRDSGALEQDANVVLLPHIPREILKDLYGEGSPAFEATIQERPALANQAFIVIAKNKDGEKGQVEVRFDYNRAMFKDKE